MAAPILLDSELSTTSSLFLATDLYAGDQAIIVVAAWNGTAGSNVPSIDIVDPLSWTIQHRETVNVEKDVYVAIAYAPVAADRLGASTNVELTNSSNHAVYLFRLPGASFVAAASAVGDTWTADPTTFTATLAAAPAASSGTLLAFGITEAFGGQNTIAPTSGWVELAGNEDGTLADLSCMVAWREGSVDPACSVEFTADEYCEAMQVVNFALSEVVRRPIMRRM